MDEIRPINKTDIVLYFFTQSTGQAFLFGFSLFLDVILNFDFFMRIAFICYFVLYSLASVYALRRSMKMLQRLHTENKVS